MTEQGFETRAIHAGQDADTATGAVVTPIYQVSTYRQDAVGELRGGHDYARTVNPHAHRARGVPRRPRGCGPRDRLRVGDGRDRHGASGAVLAGRPRRDPRRRLRRDVPAGGPRLRPVGRRAHRRRPSRTSTRSRPRCRPGETKVVWIETPTNPMLRIADIAAHRDADPRRRRAARRRQHVRDPVPAASARARRRCRRALDDEVPGGPQRRGGRRDPDERRGPRRAPPQAPERGRRDPRAPRRLAGAAGRPHPCGAHGAALRQRRGARRAPHVAPGGRERSSTQGSPRTRATTVAAAQMRRFGGMVSFRVDGGRAAAVEVCNRARALHPRRVARRRRVAHRAPRRR